MNESLPEMSNQGLRWPDWMIFELGRSLKLHYDTDIDTVPWALPFQNKRVVHADLVVRAEENVIITMAAYNANWNLKKFCERLQEKFDSIKKPIKSDVFENKSYKRSLIGISKAAELHEVLSSWYFTSGLARQAEWPLNNTNYLEKMRELKECAPFEHVHIPRNDSPNGMGYILSTREQQAVMN